MATTTPNYDINYDDKRFTQVNAEKEAALSEVENTYGSMIGESDKYYQAQIDATKQWGEQQQQLQNEQTDLAIQEINQQKAQAKQDYTKEQSGAYVDWQKQSNKYGANAEVMAAQGMANTGYSESSQVSMYNTYQNRVATARETYQRAVQNYDNSIANARLQNNAALAEIAFQTLQQSLELSLQGFQYKNTLLLEQADKKLEVDNMYYQRYRDVLDQINTENALAEEVRQYNQNYQLEQDKFAEEIRQYNQEYQQRIAEYNEEIRQFNEEIARLKASDEADAKYKAALLEQQKAELEQRKAEAEEEKRQFDILHPVDSSGDTGGSGGSLVIDKDVSPGTTRTEGTNGAAREINQKTVESVKSSTNKSTLDSLKSGRKAVTVDTGSLNNLGLSGRSAQTVNQMVKDGIIKETVKDGKISFSVSGDALKSVRSKYLGW